MAKNQGSGQGGSKASSGKGSFRSAASGRFVGRTKDGISIIGPKIRSRHFTRKQARDAVEARRGA